MTAAVDNAQNSMFPALLKYWRTMRRFSQLELAVEAEVSTRHISFLETGKATPSQSMVIRLSQTLSIPLRDQNEMLEAAGFETYYHSPSTEELLNGVVGDAIKSMLQNHDPFPMTIMDRNYEFILVNQGVRKILSLFIPSYESGHEKSLNLYDLLLNPKLMKPFVRNWENVAAKMIQRLQREILMTKDNNQLNSLLERVLAFEAMPSKWESPNFSEKASPAFSLEITKGELELSFVTTATKFNAPQSVLADELLIESYFPANEATKNFFS